MRDRECCATITPDEASKIMCACGIRLDTVTVRNGIEQGVYPFGVCIARGKRNFQIYKKPFAEWIEAKTGVVLGFSPVEPDLDALAELVK